MNYYIQGCAAKADKIKAAFENKGYSDKGFTFDVNDILFFTANNKHINVCPANGWLANIIKTHPDYKELELPVEPKFKFKVGDWVVKKDGTTFYGGNYAEQVTLIEGDGYLKRIWLSSGTWLRDNEIRLWSIQDAKDGDVLANDHHILILKELVYDWSSNGTQYSVKAYCGIKPNGNFELGKEHWCFCGTLHMRPATSEERDLLFAKMREAGYEWDADKKELHKIQPHYDIANFKPFDKVLVRDGDLGLWKCDIFSDYYDNFYCFRGTWEQCIPFEENEHLLGTTDPCGEEYINW